MSHNVVAIEFLELIALKSMWSLIALVNIFVVFSSLCSSEVRDKSANENIINHEKWCRSENYYFLSKWFKAISECVKCRQRTRDWIHSGDVIDFRNCFGEWSAWEREKEGRNSQRQVHNSCTENSFSRSSPSTWIHFRRFFLLLLFLSFTQNLCSRSN